jgi:hypothetical protein
MNAKELAQALDGSEYPLRIQKDVLDAAKKAGLVIVYGASDDLMEFEGAIYDEVGVCDGGTARVDSKGIIPEFEQIDKEAYDAKDKLREYFQRENSGKVIEALWCAEEDYSFTYKTDIPHETFNVVEDGKPYCRGIVFSLGDIG